MPRYKAIVIISGAHNQTFYGRNLRTLTDRAVKALTEHESGFGGLVPSRIDFFEHERTISGNRALWNPFHVLFYREIPPTLHECRRRRLERKLSQKGGSFGDSAASL